MANPETKGNGHKKFVNKKKVNIYTKDDCVKELARLAETHSELSRYGDDIRDRLAELK